MLGRFRECAETHGEMQVEPEPSAAAESAGDLGKHVFSITSYSAVSGGARSCSSLLPPLAQRAEPSGLSAAPGDASLRGEAESGSCRGAGSCKIQKTQSKRPCALEPPPCLALLLFFTGRQHRHHLRPRP